jgi:hypothetical protein
MASLNSRYQHSYTLELVCPPPLPGKSTSEVSELGLQIARNLCSSPEILFKLNPYVEEVVMVAHTDPEAVDIPKVAAIQGVALDADYATSEFIQYAVTERIGLIFGCTMINVNHCVLRTTHDGLEALSDPGKGVTIRSSWTAMATMQGSDQKTGNAKNAALGLEKDLTPAKPTTQGPELVDDETQGLDSGPKNVITIQETHSICCNVLLSWYIKSQFNASRKIMHERFIEAWKEEMNCGSNSNKQ